jgi:hypothetical protein
MFPGLGWSRRYAGTIVLICPLGRKPIAPCPRKRPTGGQHNECLACLDALKERAGHVAHHRGLPHVPLTANDAMALAVQQARATMPGV